jgi:intraflagellar transport protein 140
MLCVSGLAKAAVAGDERALDLFSGWRPRTAGQRFSLHMGQGDNLCFYIGALSGERNLVLQLKLQFHIHNL